MTADEMALCWVPIPLRARHLQLGDVVAGKEAGTLWLVNRCGDVVELMSCGRHASWSGHLDPDETVHVLVPLPEREALTTARDELAARVIERRAS